MRNEKLIFINRKRSRKRNRILEVLLLLLYCTLSYSCTSMKERNFEKEIKSGTMYRHGISIPVLLCTDTSEVVLTEVSNLSIINEIRQYHNAGNQAGEILYNAIKNNLPIQVSPAFFQEYTSNSRIKMDIEIDSIYKKEGVKGLIDQYFRKEYGLLCYDITYMSDKEFKPVPTYLIYLLHLHHIYIAYYEVDEVFAIITGIAEDISILPE